MSERYELDETTEEELLQTICNYITASNNFLWQALDMLAQAKVDWGWDRNKWADVKRDVADQVGRSPKTISNWATTAENWPRSRRERLGVETLGVSHLAELNGLDEERADALAIRGAEQSWTVEQFRAEIMGQREQSHGDEYGEYRPDPAGWQDPVHNPMEFFGEVGHRQWSIQLSMDPGEDARAIVENFKPDYVGELCTKLGFLLNERASA